ncbi:MAG: hypothetical protein LCH90_21235, partial [Proteobacteria bacterium]|nr:hypothetical protein [Pseudomonadota bacterium]
MKVIRNTFIAALAILTGPAFAADEPGSRDLTVEQNTVAQSGTPRPGSLQVQVASDRPDATYAIGETVRLL